jgi:polar amino acid transport system permease protein
MTASEIISVLWTWTPYLIAGFGWNILIAMVAMTVGTAIGATLAFAGVSSSPNSVKSSSVVTELSRNIPSVVFQFYLAIMLPSSVPGWIKASLAIAVTVAGFTSDYLKPAILDWRAKEYSKAILFVPNWTSYFLIVVIVSASASLIGVNEIISRCAVVINATDNVAIMLPIYLYASLFFTAFCYSLNVAMRYLRQWMLAKAKSAKANSQVSPAPIKATTETSSSPFIPSTLSSNK